MSGAQAHADDEDPPAVMGAKIDLDAIQALADAASPGPWTAEEKRAGLFVALLSWMRVSADVVNRGDREDAAFIVASRELVPALIRLARAERRLRKAVYAVEAAMPPEGECSTEAEWTKRDLVNAEYLAAVAELVAAGGEP